jgi:hypothetical protein
MTDNCDRCGLELQGSNVCYACGLINGVDCPACGHPAYLEWTEHHGMCGYIDADGPCFCQRVHGVAA